jgi:effector-binding domain-containing protein
MKLLLITVLLVVVAWSLFGYFSSRVEQTEYSVLKKTDNYEIRNYPAHLVAETTVKGSYRESLQQGFRIVAGYIFGGNTKKESISMTAPVVEQENKGQSIAMTSPVMTNIEGESHTISFGMPRSYTLKTLPTPNDSRVTIVEIPAKKMAVKRFTMWRTYTSVQSKKQELLSALSKDKITAIGEPQYAGYNAPWTPPWMMRNEVLIEVR